MKHLIHLTTLFLGLLLLGSAPVATKPTLFIIGDSTVKNGRGDGAGGLRGWGEKISLFLDTSRIEVLNHALGVPAAALSSPADCGMEFWKSSGPGIIS